MSEDKAGPELDAWIAEHVMEWKLEIHRFGYDLPGGPFWAIALDGSTHIVSMSRFSHDLSAAMEVVSKISRSDHARGFFMREYRYQWQNRYAWEVGFIFVGDRGGDEYEVLAEVDSLDKLPLAICLAAKKVKEAT